MKVGNWARARFVPNDYLTTLGAGGGPCVIGATGGSGTRVFAEAVKEAGLYVGNRFNAATDALVVSVFLDRWINTYAPNFAAPLSPEVERAMRRDLAKTLARHLSGREPGAPWGWKEPRSIYLMPFFASVFPNFRFIHVVRDGRDMALSGNQNQLRKHGDTVLGPADGVEAEVRSIRLWSWVNTKAADFGRENLGDRYLRLRYEDVCSRPEETLAATLAFFGLEGDVSALAANVEPPESLGRWHGVDSQLVARLEAEAGDALTALGYSLGAR